MRPEPNNPAIPSTSPARSSMSMGLSCPRRERLCAASTGAAPPAAGGACAGRGLYLRQLPPDHGGDQAMGVEFRAGVFADEPAIAQHGHAIADLVHLVEKMRDEQDRDAAIAQSPEELEQRLDLVRIQARGRFVEDQHPSIGGHGARYGGELLKGRGQCACELRDVELDAEIGEQFAGAALSFRPVDSATTRPGMTRIPPGADVFRHGQVRQQVALLVYGADAEVLRIQWRVRRDGSAH